MQRSLDVFLWDLQKHAGKILGFTAGMTLEDFVSNDLLRAAVERHFTILGEVLVRIRQHFPADDEELRDSRKVVNFRNQLVHLYDQVGPEEVWKIIHETLPARVDQATEMIAGMQA